MFSPSTLDPPAPTILFLPPAASLKMDWYSRPSSSEHTK
jgi:hypothetical protein